MSEDHHSIVRRQAAPASVSTPVVTPIWPSVVYQSTDADALDAQYLGETQGYTYAREGHPNAAVLAAKIDALEGARGGVVTGSGMAAVAAVFQAVLRAGDHVVAGSQLYGKSLKLLKDELPRMGVEVTLCDPTDGGAVAAALRPETKLVLVEVVSNPTLRVADMAGIFAATAGHPAMVAVDNTFTTPALYRPLAAGADLVIHSVTKMLAGHSDVTLGYAAAKDPGVAARLTEVSVAWGLTASPFDCWLAERGMHSFELRFARAQETAAALAHHLSGKPGVEAVIYPARPDHPDHNRAQGLLCGQGGAMVSFRLAGGREAANAFLRAARHIPFAPTLGDVATMFSHPAVSSHRALTTEAREALGITEGFIRCSVGIEAPDLLMRELDQALAASLVANA
ncbi:MAG: PLP-dependent transferase [Pseudomonadota bacterium]